MPITLPYSFDETDELVVIRIHLKGATRSQMSVTVADCYVKVNCPPHHFLELDLKEEIVLDASARAQHKIEGHDLVLQFRKVERKRWETAVRIIDDNNTKEMIEKRRVESMERLQKIEEQEREEKKKEKLKEEKRLLEKHWEDEKQKREEIERKKQIERDQAAVELQEFKKKETIVSDVNDKDTSAQQIVSLPQHRTQPIIEDVTDDHEEDVAVDSKAAAYERCEAPVRGTETSTIKLSFTPRALRTPAREDKDSETLKKFEIWKRKNKKSEFEDSVVWVIERGDKFMKKQNFSSAISAYTEALSMDSNAISCLSKRASCYFERQEYLKAIEDCTQFLQTEAKHEMDVEDKYIALALMTRAKSYQEIGDFKKALEDANLAYKLEATLDCQKIIKHLENLLSDNNSTIKDKAELLKEEGDAEYFEKRFEKAVSCYTNAINLKPFFFRAYSNRAACYLQLNKFSNCIEDCTYILENIHSKAAGETERKQSASLILKSYTRRGTCYFKLGDFQRSYKDYEQASRMAPEDDDIMTDLERVNKELTSQLQGDWLKNTANNFYLNQDYASAIHSYTLAIQLDKTNPVYYSNRAQCYFKLGDYVKCVKDCNLALSVLSDEDEKKVTEILKEEEAGMDKETNKTKPEFPTNPKLTPKLQTKLYLKRAAAYKEMEEYERAFLDIRRAQQFEPDNKEIKSEFEKIEVLYNNWKKEQDEKAKIIEEKSKNK
ncbi:hypothetical protein C9374_005358 [Naegleria lovaniensis]|uniref:CS domain-containing protein n=1 Tax=Naegleria lovaniensis TaxID=51637 RepID=A0AA88GJI7_NAELO|nr:uncharacterized protein C9374_005358 [Naegleria lovaniensis]KAG2382156.1 hypothetical protein C9374_005358 [Naegleria lovaniensis]